MSLLESTLVLWNKFTRLPDDELVRNSVNESSMWIWLSANSQLEVGWIERSISAFTMSVCAEYIDLGSVNSRLDAMLPAVEKKMRTALIGRLWHLRTLLKVLNLRKGEPHAADTNRWTNADLMPGQRRRRWPGNESALVQRFLFAGHTH